MTQFNLEFLAAIQEPCTEKLLILYTLSFTCSLLALKLSSISIARRESAIAAYIRGEQPFESSSSIGASGPYFYKVIISTIQDRLKQQIHRLCCKLLHHQCVILPSCSSWCHFHHLELQACVSLEDAFHLIEANYKKKQWDFFMLSALITSFWKKVPQVHIRTQSKNAATLRLHWWSSSPHAYSNSELLSQLFSRSFLEVLLVGIAALHRLQESCTSKPVENRGFTYRVL